MNFCVKCGAPVDPADKFCHNCGTALVAPAAAPVPRSRTLTIAWREIPKFLWIRLRVQLNIVVNGKIYATIRPCEQHALKVPDGVLRVQLRSEYSASFSVYGDGNGGVYGGGSGGTRTSNVVVLGENDNDASFDVEYKSSYCTLVRVR
jgi:hypothetical protein